MKNVSRELSGKAKVVINLNGEQIPFLVESSDEPYFREAKNILNERLTDLSTDYSAFAGRSRLVSVLAVEALVDALKINERYQKLRIEVEERLDSIQARFDD